MMLKRIEIRILILNFTVLALLYNGYSGANENIQNVSLRPLTNTLNLCVFSIRTGEISANTARPGAEDEPAPNTISAANISGSNISVANFSFPSCSVPPYCPDFWNDGSTVQDNNNCYNYSNNKRTDTFAQPGKAGSAQSSMPFTCEKLSSAALADGLLPLPASGVCPDNSAKLALVLAPCEKKSSCTFPLFFGNDFHWYRMDSDVMWSHKPGKGLANSLDNSGNPITNPETADRSLYKEFCGYFCACSDFVQGNGHEYVQ